MGIDHVISTSINATIVTWNPPIEPNGVITRYEVVYSVYGLDTENIIGPLERDVYTINITGLGECYLIAVYVLYPNYIQSNTSNQSRVFLIGFEKSHLQCTQQQGRLFTITR